MDVRCATYCVDR